MAFQVKIYNQFGFNLRGKTSGVIKTTCPFCSKERKKKSERCVYIDLDSQHFECFNCGKTGFIHETERVHDKIYSKPKPIIQVKNYSDKLIKYFKNRGLSEVTLKKAKVSEQEEFMIDKKVNCILFNYYRDNELVNIKYRTADKKFKLCKGAELIFYNIDGIKNENECIVTEGEVDTLSYIEVGLNNVVSVPNGAAKGNSELIYLDNCIEYFINKKIIYLATDNDDAGLCLQNELLRRFGSDKCRKINFGKCKDANEYLVKYGKEALLKTISDAAKFPIESVVTVKDIEQDFDYLYHNGFDTIEPMGWNGFDYTGKDYEGIKDAGALLETGRLCVITGIPSHGKSEVVDMILIKTALNLKWKWGIFSPENYPLEVHLKKLSEKLIGKDLRSMSNSEYQTSKDFSNEHFYFLFPDETKFNLDYILERGRLLVAEYGIRGLVIDPYNTLEYQIGKGENETLFVSRQLEKMRNFARMKNVLLILVAHPRKMQTGKNDLVYKVPTLYDISGSSHFYNKCDYGICVYRDFNNPKVTINFQKIKFKHYGQTGSQDFNYIDSNGRLVKMDSYEDKDNWLLADNSEQSVISYDLPKNEKFDEPDEPEPEQDYAPNFNDTDTAPF
jgi:twinkle protein